MLQRLIHIVTRSVEPNQPADFFTALRRYIPPTYPKRFYTADDVHFPFDETSFHQFVELWWKGFVFWDSVDSHVAGNAFLGNKHQHTNIVHTFPASMASDADCSDCLIGLAKTLQADYAFFHAYPVDQAIREADKPVCGVIPWDLRLSLPGIPWAACYGRAYVELFGKDNLLSLPIKETKEIGDSMVFCKLTERLLDIVEDTSLIDECREAVYEYLGRDAFLDPDERERQGRVPEFKKPLVMRP
jgi:hypothetical protein